MAQSPTKYWSYPKSLGNEAKQGHHYVLFNSYESKNAVEKKGLMKSSIALYIPTGALTITTGQTYQDVAGGATMAATAGGFTNMQGGWWEKSKRIMQGGADVATGMLSKPEAVQNFMSSAFGLAKNNHIALAYKGPAGFRQHAFTFQFFPKSKTEADEVNEIIKDFHNGSTPRTVGVGGGEQVTRITAPYFSSPRQYEIKFMKGGKREGGADGYVGAGRNNYLYELKRSVITSMTINHDPDSVVSFHEDGSPVHSSMTLQFQEIEYVTSGDAVDAEFNKEVMKMEQQKIELESRSKDPTQLSSGQTGFRGSGGIT